MIVRERKMFISRKSSRIITKVIIIAMLVATFALQFEFKASAAPSYNVTGVVCSPEGANVRAGASTATKKVTYLKKGTKVTILREHFTTNSTALTKKWFYISANGHNGFIRADLVNKVVHNKANTLWATDDLNFRQTPGTNGERKGAFSKGEAFYTVLPATAAGSKATWYKVRVNNNFYYVVGSYVTFSKPSDGAASVTTSKKVVSGDTANPNVQQSAASQKVAADAVAWAIKIANDNSFHYGNGHHAHHNGCYFCNTQPSSKKKYVVGWEKTYCCNPFVHAAYAHGGKDQTMLKVCKNYGSYDWEYLKTHNKLFAKLGHPAKESLKKGDVLCLDGHMAMYIGDGKLVEAGFEDDGKKYSSSWNNSISVSTLTDRRYRGFTHVYRYIGKN